MERTGIDVDAWLASVGGATGEALRALDALIAPEFAGLERALWRGVFWGGTDQDIVGYGAIRQERPRGASVDWFLVGLAAQAKHFSVYVNAVDDGEYLVRRLAPTLGRVKVGAAAVTFASPDRLDRDGFVAMLRQTRALATDVR
ncbi:DUF1801 domain-containing protein [Agromyces protaetiae]|uniref:DUF1801 domain-containing protein n=1 Tax=Agromyces protaetiae TaxID=2509455 RepID=A0A4P6FD60_9MICO|nr:DUF1801 domain-containing protein [Agromyces protaetiae]QAY72903.1 DUF1801 domain-containing protein [Agromyces protaetiae]